MELYEENLTETLWRIKSKGEKSKLMYLGIPPAVQEKLASRNCYKSKFKLDIP